MNHKDDRFKAVNKPKMARINRINILGVQRIHLRTLVLKCYHVYNYAYFIVYRKLHTLAVDQKHKHREKNLDLHKMKLSIYKLCFRPNSYQKGLFLNGL